MLTIKELIKEDIGHWVEYRGGAGEVERGKIKSWNDSGVFVVYKCNNEWDRFQDFTGVSTNPEDLTFVLTLDDLKKIEQGIFAQGETFDSPEGANMANTGKQIKWVAVRGFIHDWAIYTDNPYSPQEDFESVASMGDKIHDRETVKKLVPCDEEALTYYRD